MIRENLFHAPQHMRYAHFYHNLWLEAIWIDQNDIHSRLDRLLHGSITGEVSAPAPTASPTTTTWEHSRHPYNQVSPLLVRCALLHLERESSIQHGQADMSRAQAVIAGGFIDFLALLSSSIISPLGRQEVCNFVGLGHSARPSKTQQGTGAIYRLRPYYICS